MSKNNYYTKTELKERGWTESIIKKMEITPDLFKQNPYYKSSPAMKLYSIESIKKLEKTEQFIKLKEKSEKRKKSAKKAVESKKRKNIKNLNKRIKELEINGSYKKFENLKRDAINYYNCNQWNIPSVYSGKRDANIISEDTDKNMLKRIMKNFVRHELSNYDDVLIDIKGKVGVHSDLYPRLRKEIDGKVNDWIGSLNLKKEDC